ncbi:signal transduction histidine kinase [Actinoalloteichus hoggarensis]|uniref:Oxygen sensor histidine kinase NreB n=1 Tax=Actinoalloteichus hoggarensis TaxID=1470176 RepID=A0A221W8R7_9PSEU|nr:sensor histidine kinase [Actinoalloteichus hoggarensis]ASO22071.1 Signal transduction histidine-protein kinase/phosphatase DegS [Actinoalloteichus hoggarensis]MBB5923847.1 signal transduction histidine kinase [Actinoalloteichus hoggarensis]
MSIEAELREEFDRWERREIAVIGVLPYVLLAVSTVVALLQPVWGESVPVAAVLGLAFLTTCWLAWFDVAGARGRPSPRLTGLYYAGLALLAGGLTAIAPWYGIFAFVGYVHAFLFLRGAWRYVGVTVTAMIAAVSYVGGVAAIDGNGWWEWAALFLVTSVLAASFFHFAELGYRRNDQQKRALAELHEANVRLEAALEENAGLHAQLLVQAREAGVQEERQRMAREIHDTLAQSLAGILTQLQAAEQTTGDPSTLRRHMTNAMNLARDSLTEARRTVHAVGPELLADARLADAIHDVTRRWSEANGVDVMLTTTGDPRPMHADVEVTLLRAAQEALANVAKHARAGRVGLTLSYMEDLVTLDVRDDGVGFDPEVRRVGGADGGFGLAGMRQRVQRLAGRLDIESEPGGGTALSASVPAIPAGCGS